MLDLGQSDLDLLLRVLLAPLVFIPSFGLQLGVFQLVERTSKEIQLSRKEGKNVRAFLYSWTQKEENACSASIRFFSIFIVCFLSFGN